MRLIDADALLSQYSESAIVELGEYGDGCLDIIADIEHAPTINAVPVVRCKDCDHMENRFNARFCKVWCMFNGFGDDGFCNYGYPKDGANDGR